MNASNQPIRVLVVDDSAFIRYTISKNLNAVPDFVVVGSARDGVDALNKVATLRPDVITMDVEMPRMDGLTALKHIMDKHPTPVVMLSSLTQEGASTTIRALMRGAVDFVPKPSNSTKTRAVVELLIDKIRVAAGAELKAHPAHYDRQPVEEVLAEPTPVVTPKPVVVPRAPTPPAGLQAFQIGDPLIVIGSSTGGPRALHEVLTRLPGDLPAAVLVVQHMPPGFTQSLARRLNDASAITVQEAMDKDRLARGVALLAPGDFHMTMLNPRQVGLEQSPRRNHLRPAADVTMEFAAELHGSAVIGVVLTGMGSDGTDGARAIKAHGGTMIVQDESTSVVYGMPRGVVQAGLADRVLPLNEIAQAIVDAVAVVA